MSEAFEEEQGFEPEPVEPFGEPAAAESADASWPERPLQSRSELRDGDNLRRWPR